MVVLAAVLAYDQARAGLAGMVPQPSTLGLLSLVALVIATLVSRLADVAIVAQAALPLLLFATLWTALGWKAVRRFWPPLLFLYFAIPVWQVLDFTAFDAPSLNEGLRRLTTFVVSGAIRATAVTAYIDGNFVHLPSGTFEIAEGCSGRGFFLVALQIGLFYGLMWLDRWKLRLALIVVVGGLALVANWVRVYSIILVGHASEMKHALVADHSTFGWVVFLLIVVGPLIVIGRATERVEARSMSSSAGASASSPSKPSQLPWDARPVWRRVFSRGAALPALAVVVLIAGALLDGRVQAARSLEPRVGPITLPALDDWRRDGSWTGADRPTYLGASAEAAAWYARGEERIGVYVASYAVQRQSREVVYYLNRPWGNDARERANHSGVVSVPVDDASEPFAEWVVAGPDSSRLVWRGLRVAGHVTADEMMAKLYQVAGAVVGRNDAQILAISTICDGDRDCGVARKRLSEFATGAVATLYGHAERAAAVGGAGADGAELGHAGDNE
jgi:EpsI family protein